MTGIDVSTKQRQADTVRQIDTGAYVSVLRQLVESGKEVNLRVSGNSMAPFLIHQRDMVYFGPVRKPIKKGKIVFYQRDNGQFVMHRLYRVRGNSCWMIGDAQTQIEGPLTQDHIFGEITAVSRKGKMIQPGDFWWEFFEHIWIRVIPFRRHIIRFYSWIQEVNRDE